MWTKYKFPWGHRVGHDSACAGTNSVHEGKVKPSWPNHLKPSHLNSNCSFIIVSVEIKLPAFIESGRKQRCSKKKKKICFTDYTKTFDCVDHNKL